MLLKPNPKSQKSEVALASERTEEEYAQLVSLIRDSAGHYSLFPIRSYYDINLRDALLKRLAEDISPLNLKLVRATEAGEDLVKAILRAACDKNCVVALIDLELLPDSLLPSRSGSERMTRIASLNHGREALRRAEVPVLVWCNGASYQALKQDAKDFFDHFTALFEFSRGDYEMLGDIEVLPHLRNGSTSKLSNRPDFSGLDRFIQSSLPGSNEIAASDVAFYESELAANPEPGEARIRSLLGLSEALIDVQDNSPTTRLQRVISLLDEALICLSPEDHPYAWGRAQNMTGRAYRYLPTGLRDANLRRALTCHQVALRVFTENEFPQDWATTQYNLGNAYVELPSGERGANLRRAIKCYESALRVRIEATFPQVWAATQNNLGVAYLYLPSGERDANLRRAIECYEAALRVYTQTAFPQEWAATQNNLGLAYSVLPSGERDANLRRAIECYESALKVRTEAAFPQDLAMTQNNLGLAYSFLTSGDRDANLRRAVECFESALRVYTEATFPQYWARTQNNLALALLHQAKEARKRAVRGYRS